MKIRNIPIGTENNITARSQDGKKISFITTTIDIEDIPIIKRNTNIIATEVIKNNNKILKFSSGNNLTYKISCVIKGILYEWNAEKILNINEGNSNFLVIYSSDDSSKNDRRKAFRISLNDKIANIISGDYESMIILT